MTTVVTDTRRSRIVVLASCLGFFLINLDATIVTVALPVIGERLGAGVSGLQWVVAGYTLAFAGLLLTAGSVSDRVGATRVFGYGLLAFSAASAACGFASDTGFLIVARVLQGAAAAAVLPASLALLRQSLPDPAARAKAIAIWAAGGGAAVAAGPLAGGFLTARFGWEAIFFVNVPFALLAILGLSRADRSTRQRSPIDLRGQIAAVVALTAFTFAVIEIAPMGLTSPAVYVPLLVAVAAALWFTRVDLRELRSRVFVSCLSTGFALNFAYYGIMFVFSIVFQQERGWSPLMTGLSFLPLTAVVLASNIAGGKLTALIGPRLPMAGAQLLEATGFLGVLLVGAHGPTWLLLLAMVPIGVGGGLASPPMMTALLESVAAERAGVVSGLLSSCRQAGGVLGVAVFGVLVSATGFETGFRVSAGLAAALLGAAAVAAFRNITPGVPGP
ncbi:MFS transporter, DHA2 family, methylenomycin A resistance protein [Amycolatopsis xylanica]|uniref:MFS transporter, DHA2 family, methylenomycin A resistance protein n=1 Tax=Amycolatopsis xylanica TaxID=589385 RepID=A0A1H2TXZ5_9PSEU|nr:MFS transporter [Amycolatopsis xylanica]SDW48169.1 MFS transporter, DHA2 family, methylenomycin A resistance protein [Amycolatopsis xylanica]